MAIVHLTDSRERERLPDPENVALRNAGSLHGRGDEACAQGLGLVEGGEVGERDGVAVDEEAGQEGLIWIKFGRIRLLLVLPLLRDEAMDHDERDHR